MLKLKLQYLATWCEALTHWKRPWCWERLKAGEGDDRRWTQWTWIWVSSGSWWWTGKPGMLQSWRAGVAKSQTRLSDWTEFKTPAGVGAFLKVVWESHTALDYHPVLACSITFLFLLPWVLRTGKKLTFLNITHKAQSVQGVGNNFNNNCKLMTEVVIKLEWNLPISHLTFSFFHSENLP